MQLGSVVFIRPKAIDLLTILTDDRKAKQVFQRGYKDMGFDAAGAGSLVESWRHQLGTPALKKAIVKQSVFR